MDKKLLIFFKNKNLFKNNLKNKKQKFQLNQLIPIFIKWL